MQSKVGVNLKDCILTFLTNYDWDAVKNFVLSLNSTTFVGDKVVIAGNLDNYTINKLKEHDFKVVCLNLDIEGNSYYNPTNIVGQERFTFYLDYINKNKYRYIICIDCRDVYFQKNPIPSIEKLINGYDLLLNSEDMLYKDEHWNIRNYILTFGYSEFLKIKDKKINNSGVIIGNHYGLVTLFEWLINFLFLQKEKEIGYDQSIFNYGIYHNQIKCKVKIIDSKEPLVINLGTYNILNFHNYINPLPIIEDDIVKNNSGVSYHIVHQYDRIPELLDTISIKYSHPHPHSLTH